MSERLQDYVCLKGRVTRLQKMKDYKSLSKREKAIFFLDFEPKTCESRNWTLLLPFKYVLL